MHSEGIGKTGARLPTGPPPDKRVTSKRLTVLAARFEQVEKKLKALLDERNEIRRLMFAEMTKQQPKRLTLREMEIYSHIRVNPFASIKELSSHFSISQRTVKYHLFSIYQKNGVSNRAELVAATIPVEQGLIQ